MIPVKNVYYMLSYAFSVLEEKGYKRLSKEEYDNIDDLCAAILIRGVNLQIKRGLNRDYITNTEALSSLKGRIEVSESLKNMTIVKNQLVCSYDEFSENSQMNRIIKTTILRLLKANIDKGRKKDLKKILVYFSNIEVIDLHNVNWNMHYNRNNKTYQMLMFICYMVYYGYLQGGSGKTKTMDFDDVQRRCKLYERFILEYYRKEYSKKSEYKGFTANASKIEWQIAHDDTKTMLPEMKSDIMLTYKGKTLIIDAKYYEHSLQTSQYGMSTIHSSNLYQIFTYVKNKQTQVGDDHEVAGMLLYAKTADQVQPNNKYNMSGNEITVKTLDLNQDFSDISRNLDDIVYDFFLVRDK